jgi:hypothetical protein
VRTSGHLAPGLSYQYTPPSLTRSCAWETGKVRTLASMKSLASLSFSASSRSLLMKFGKKSVSSSVPCATKSPTALRTSANTGQHREFTLRLYSELHHTLVQVWVRDLRVVDIVKRLLDYLVLVPGMFRHVFLCTQVVIFPFILDADKEKRDKPFFLSNQSYKETSSASE